jgi:hypothetical protein
MRLGVPYGNPRESADHSPFCFHSDVQYRMGMVLVPHWKGSANAQKSGIFLARGCFHPEEGRVWQCLTWLAGSE